MSHIMLLVTSAAYIYYKISALSPVGCILLNKWNDSHFGMLCIESMRNSERNTETFPFFQIKTKRKKTEIQMSLGYNTICLDYTSTNLFQWLFLLGALLVFFHRRQFSFSIFYALFYHMQPNAYK